ncbi:MAG: hypothetical protein D6731_15340 [Planctomycetota bacterium]|nr:MAG: hypothetical protein D6731_15340 [Planctomycetota bacterium]
MDPTPALAPPTRPEQASAADPHPEALAGRDLSGRDLSGRDLSGRDLSGATLVGADLSGTRLVGARLRAADLSEACLAGAELLGADLSGARLERCRAPRAGFGEATLERANLSMADLSGASLGRARLDGADLRAANLREARLQESSLRGADLTQADLRRSDLGSANVSGARLTNADLRHARVAGLVGYRTAHWLGADIREVDFCGAYRVRRHILDENYIAEFHQRHPLLFWLWSLTSDCGRSFARWGLVTAGIVLLFAFLYERTGLDHGHHPAGLLTALYFSVVTMTTLGYGDVQPNSPLGQLLVMGQVVLGYLALGGLISIFGNKMSRRAD